MIQLNIAKVFNDNPTSVTNKYNDVRSYVDIIYDNKRFIEMEENITFVYVDAYFWQ